MKLTGSMSQCTACGLVFATVRGFDGHRSGNFAKSNGKGSRHCLTVPALLSAGYCQEERGVWLTPDAKAYQEAKDTPRDTPVATTPALEEVAP